MSQHRDGSSDGDKRPPLKRGIAEVVDAKESEKCDLANALLFGELCRRLESVSMARGTDRKREILFDERWLPSTQSLYPVIRLVLPQIEKDRARYGLAEKKLAGLYDKTMSMCQESRKQLAYHTGKDRSTFGASDLGVTIKEIMEREQQKTPSFQASIKDANDFLDKLARNSGDARAQEQAVRAARHFFTPLEHKWLARIICGEMKTGLKERGVLNAIRREAYSKFEQGLGLRDICAMQETPLPKTIIEVGRPFLPMLAHSFKSNWQKRDQFAAAEKELGGDPFLVDEKLDGNRILCHVDARRNIYSMFSRNITVQDDKHTSEYLPVFKRALEQLRCESCILDGELIVYDSGDPRQKTLPFGSNLTIAHFERDGANTSQQRGPPPSGWTQREFDDARLRYVCFDLIHIDGEDLVSRPLSERRARLSQLLANQEDSDRITLCRHKTYEDDDNGAVDEDPARPGPKVGAERTVVSAKHRSSRGRSVLMEYYEAVVAQGGEGVVVKNLKAPYEFGKRSAHWLKIKPDYVNARTVDCVIVGGYWSTQQRGGARFGQIGAFLLAVRDATTKKYATLCKVGTGYTGDEHRAVMKKVGQDNWGPLDPLPEWWFGETLLSGSEKPDRLIQDISRSVVLEVKIYEMVKSTSYAAGATLRMPRVQRLRFDKTPSEIDTTDDVASILRAPKHLVTQSPTTASPSDSIRKKKRKVSPGDRLAIDYVEHAKLRRKGKKIFVVHREGDEAEESEPMEFLVLPHAKSGDAEIERLIAANGGRPVVLAGKDVLVVGVLGKDKLRVELAKDNGNESILDAAWIKLCSKAGRFLHPRPYDYIVMSRQDSERMKRQFDPIIGTHLSLPESSPDQLLVCFEHAKRNRIDSHFYTRQLDLLPDELELRRSAVDELRSAHANHIPKVLRLHGLSFLVSQSVTAYKPLLEWFGASVVTDASKAVVPLTHALVAHADDKRPTLPVKVVNPAWIETTLASY